jgi:rRNA-processing protein FCF1
MTKRGKRLVIDTDVIRSAGGENATEIRSTNCRDVLKTILSASHVVVITKDESASRSLQKERIPLVT